jgi:hypothetical protein
VGRSFSRSSRLNPATVVNPETLHAGATTDSLRHAPSLPFDGVIPCQSGHDIHGLDPCKIEAALAGPELGWFWTRIRIHANHTIWGRVSWLFVLMIFRMNSESHETRLSRLSPHFADSDAGLTIPDNRARSKKNRL